MHLLVKGLPPYSQNQQLSASTYEQLKWLYVVLFIEQINPEKTQDKNASGH